MTEWRKLEHRARQMTLTLRTTATPEQVNRAWADPEGISRWFADKAHGEARPGATMTWIFETFGFEVPYEVKDAVPGERFALGGQLPGRPPFLLEITIRKDGGETLLTLVNSGFRETDGWDDEYEGIHSGWALSLALLKHHVENHDGTAKRGFLLMRPAEFEYPELLPHFSTVEGLGKWIASRATIGATGEPYALDLRDGGRVSGRVLAISKWEVALSWSETGGVLEMKGFSAPGIGKVVGLRGTFWGKSPAEVAALEAQLSPALDRLAALLPPA